MHTISKRNIIITIICIAVIVFLVISGKKKTAQVTPPTVTTDVPMTVSWPSTEVKKETITDSQKTYHITAAYPVTKSPAINTTIKGFIDDQITTFKTDITGNESDMNNAVIDEGSKLSLDINYTEDKNTLADNYIFSIATYTGGAHGLTLTKTFSYTEKGFPLTLADLFTNETKALTMISTYVQGELAKRDFGDEGWIKDGTIPTEENYGTYTVNGSGITFIFAPYQVAPYAAGEQKVTVPLSVFKSVASPTVFATH